MLRITAYFQDSSLPITQIELAGLSKRMSALGFQPIPGDQFSYVELGTEDKRKIENIGQTSITSLTVTSRTFRFEEKFSAVYITLSPTPIQ